MISQKEGLKVVLFSGGRGTTSISDALLKYPDIDLTMLVNAYDDGKSTGLLRRFIPGMLGPSDIRKVVVSLLKHKPDRASQALGKLIDYRFPDEVQTDEALDLLNQLIHWESTAVIDHELLKAKEDLSLTQLRHMAHYLSAFLAHYQANIKNNSWFTFGDNGMGNLFFAGCFLLADKNFNRAIQEFCQFAEIGNSLVNITLGENLVLTALKENGQYLADEASIVGPQDASPIEEIFLLPHYIDAQEINRIPRKSDKIEKLRQIETLPQLNPAADALLRDADIIIYGPGTQHSSLLPSYLTEGVAEAIQSNIQAEKIFIANIARDHDILTADASSLVDSLLFNMSRKGSVKVQSQKLVSRFFFQKPEAKTDSGDNYLPFKAGKFAFPLEKVIWIDLEGDKGKHSGGRTVSELLIVVEEQLQKRIRHVPHKVSIVVPILNEEKTIQAVLQDLRDVHVSQFGLEKEIIVVDGGSLDDSVALLKEEAGIRFFELPNEKGRGMALRYGIEKARGDIVIFFPSDGEYKADDITRVISPIINQEFPVVFGSRAFRSDLSGTLQRVYGNRGALFTMSKYGGMLMSTLTLVLYHRYVGDPLTSIKGFNSRVFRDMEFQRRGVDFDMEVIAKVARGKYPILEVPVSYKARTIQQGKKITVGDGIKCLITLIRFSHYTSPIQRRRATQKALTSEQSI